MVQNEYIFFLFFFWRERVAIFIGLDVVENIRETAPTEKKRFAY